MVSNKKHASLSEQIHHSIELATVLLEHETREANLLAEESHKAALDYLDGLAANGVARARLLASWCHRIQLLPG